MSDELFKIKMLKFLETYYPVSRVKYNGHFKRAIVIGDSIFVLSDYVFYLQVQHELLKILVLVFDMDDEINRNVLYKFLPPSKKHKKIALPSPLS